MRLFKTADKKFEDIGFTKIYDNERSVRYQRYNSKHNYTHVIDIGYKDNGEHIIQSYEERVNSDKFNNVVGLTMYETKLCIQKMKEKGWKR